MSISNNLNELKRQLPEGVTLVAVSKFHPVEALQEAYNAGQRIFGESRAQELVVKQKQLPTDIEWHFIGSLQRNKVKEIAPFISMIQSIDSLRLLQEVNKQATLHNRTIRILLEIHVAKEEAKHGFSPAECIQLCQTFPWKESPNVQLCGLMGMATFTEDESIVRGEFEQLHQLFTQLKSEYFADDPHFNTLSMGMSGDYPLAIESGSNMIRVGTSIFGEREY